MMSWCKRHTIWARVMGLVIAASLIQFGARMIAGEFEMVGFAALGLGMVIPLVIAAWLVIQKEKGARKKEKEDN